ncbi:MAG: ABC transporter ATP-binding protein [Fervidobacterium sp.]
MNRDESKKTKSVKTQGEFSKRIVLRAFNISKEFTNLKIIENISFNLESGESVAFLGPSGCGKTTLLRIIAGLEKNFQGELQRGYRSMGYVFQEPRLIPWKSVFENLKFVTENEEMICDILRSFKIEKFANYLPSQLSGGMRQRVNLARALLTKPDILFLDEPFSSLDLHTKISIINDIIIMRENLNFSMILVTHDVREAILLSDRIILLSDKPSKVICEYETRSVQKDIFSEDFKKAESKIISEILGRWSSL